MTVKWHVQHRIHKLYLESCSHAWTRWGREFTQWQNASEMEPLGAQLYRMEHLYDEAVAEVVARHTYDEHECPTLKGTPANI